MELSRAIRLDDPHTLPEPSHLIKQTPKNFSAFKHIIYDQFTRLGLKIVTVAKNHLLFALPTPGQKVLIPAQDGTVLEGLYLPKTPEASSTIVIALIGHFPIESRYFTQNFCTITKFISN